MRLIDRLQEVLWAFRKQRLRTTLTAMGIAIGTFAIVVMIGLGNGLQTYIEGQVMQFSNERVLMVFPQVVKPMMRMVDRLNNLGKPAPKLRGNDRKLRRIRRGGLWIAPDQVEALRALPQVAEVAPMTWFELDGVSLVEAPGDYYQTDYAALSTSPLVGTPTSGRRPNLDEDQVCVLSPQYAQSFALSAAELVGRQVVLRAPKLNSVTQRFMYRDPGSYKPEHKTFTATVVGLAETSLFSRVVYPSVQLGRQIMRYQSGNDQLLSDTKIGFQAHVRIAEGADIEDAKRAIGDLGLVARSLQDNLAQLSRVFLVIDGVLTSFGLLALLVATMGIVNTLLMAVTERTQEIGIMVAVGANARLIRALFAWEAAAIGLVGGAAGIASALGLGMAVNRLAPQFLPEAASLSHYQVFVFPWWLLIGAVAFATLIATLAGLYPAAKAARLDAVEALQRD